MHTNCSLAAAPTPAPPPCPTIPASPSLPHDPCPLSQVVPGVYVVEPTAAATAAEDGAAPAPAAGHQAGAADAASPLVGAGVGGGAAAGEAGHVVTSVGVTPVAAVATTATTAAAMVSVAPAAVSVAAVAPAAAAVVAAVAPSDATAAATAATPAATAAATTPAAGATGAAYLSWLPPTFAAVALRISTLDASLLYAPSAGKTGRDQTVGYRYTCRPPVIIGEPGGDPRALTPQDRRCGAILVAPTLSLGKIRALQLLPLLPGEFMCLAPRDFVPPLEALRSELAGVTSYETPGGTWEQRPAPSVKVGGAGGAGAGGGRGGAKGGAGRAAGGGAGGGAGGARSGRSGRSGRAAGGAAGAKAAAAARNRCAATAFICICIHALRRAAFTSFTCCFPFLFTWGTCLPCHGVTLQTFALVLPPHPHVLAPPHFSSLPCLLTLHGREQEEVKSST